MIWINHDTDVEFITWTNDIEEGSQKRSFKSLEAGDCYDNVPVVSTFYQWHGTLLSPVWVLRN